MNIHPTENAISICRVLNNAGFEAYLVGGAIRDSIIGRAPNDWDIATNALPVQVANLFARVVDTGIDHGTVTVILDGESFEVTTYRVDGHYSDGRRPDSVQFSDSIKIDLSRRDFTINAIAHDPLSGEVVDPFGGVDDIARKVVHAVGDADSRLNEDTLRALRAVRFAAVLGFSIGSKTFEAIERCRLSVAAERVRVELVKGLLSPLPSRFLGILLGSDMLAQVLPEMLPMIGCEQNKYHEFDVWDHTMRVTDATPKEQHLRLAAMLHDVAKPDTKGTHPVTGEPTFYDHEKTGADVADAILRRLKFSNEDRERIVHLVRYHLVPELKSPASIRRWARKVGLDNVSDIISLARADCVGKGVSRAPGLPNGYLDWLTERIASMGAYTPIVTTTTQLAVTGLDVMSTLEIGPGPAVGIKLRELLELVTDDQSLNDRYVLLSILANGR